MLQSIVTHETGAGKTSQNTHLKQTRTVNKELRDTTHYLHDLFEIEQLKLHINNVTKPVYITSTVVGRVSRGTAGDCPALHFVTA